MSNSATENHGVLGLVIHTKEDLYRSYMPYISQGGLFVPTADHYELGEEVFLVLSLMGEPDKIPVTGKVVWITPPGAQGGKVTGIGVQLAADETELLKKIETYLAGSQESGRRTYTL
jgi:type IV pilus assembly protein PilZ